MKRVAALAVCLGLGACNLLGPSDNDALRGVRSAFQNASATLLGDAKKCADYARIDKVTISNSQKVSDSVYRVVTDSSFTILEEYARGSFVEDLCLTDRVNTSRAIYSPGDTVHRLGRVMVCEAWSSGWSCHF